MAKKPDAFQIVTDAIVAKLEEGTIPWRKPWNANSQLPKNLATGKHYRGINIWLLMAMGFEKAKKFLENHPDIKGYLIYADESGDIATWQSPDF